MANTLPGGVGGGGGGGGDGADYDPPRVDLGGSPAQDSDTDFEDINEPDPAPAPDPDPQEPDPSNTTGLGGSMGDSPTEERNTVGGTDATVPPSSTTGLTNDGTTVVDRNEPHDPTAEQLEDSDGSDSLDVDRTGINGDPDTTVADQVEDATENNPYVDDTTDDEFTDIQEEHGANPDLPSDVADTVSNATPNVEVPNVEVPEFNNPFNAGPLGWLADNLWWAVLAVVGIVVLYLLQPILKLVTAGVGE